LSGGIPRIFPVVCGPPFLDHLIFHFPAISAALAADEILARSAVKQFQSVRTMPAVMPS
jgi:hypothetical protein